jgi:hypothetical protein
MLVARLAGRYPASAVTAMSSADTAASVAGSRGATP